MAGRPAGTKKEVTDADVVVNDVSKSDDNKNIMDLLKQMQAELKSLKAENETLKSSSKTVVESTLTSDSEIEVMSLFSGSLTLYTEGYGNGTPYKFEDGYGSIIDIPLGELKLIVKNNNKISKIPLFYILNEEAVGIVRLKRAYENLLDIEKMENLSKLNDDGVVSIYKTAPDSQKELIIAYFASKRASGESVSQELLFKLGELCGRNLLAE